jgi:hypothetical protein
MYELIYRNLETGILIKEYCFANREEKRRLFLDDNGYEIVSCKRLMDTFLSRSWWRNYWKCATRETWDITPL